MIQVTLYTKADCHLCDVAREDLAALQTEFPHQLIEINIDEDPVSEEDVEEEDDPLHPKRKVPLTPVSNDSGTLF